MWELLPNLLGATGLSQWLMDHIGLVLFALVVLVAIVFGLGDMLRFSGGRVWAISGVVFAESIRRRVLWITPLAIIGVMVVSQLTRPIDEQDAIRQTAKFCLFTTGLVVVIVGILLACTSLPKEIENRVIFTIVTKPTTRLEIVIGKTLGFARVSAAILVIMGVFTAVYLQARAWNLRREIASRLDAGTVDPISQPTLHYYREAGLLNAKTYVPQADLQFYARLPQIGEKRRYFTANGDHLVLIPFDLSPKMFSSVGNQKTTFELLIGGEAGWEPMAGSPAVAPTTSPTTSPSDEPTTAPALSGPSPLLSSTQPTTAPVAKPSVIVQFLDHEETTLIPNTDLNGGQPLMLGEAGKLTRFAVPLDPASINKLYTASQSPVTRRVYVAIMGNEPSFQYFVESTPIRMVTLIRTAGEEARPLVTEIPVAAQEDGKPSDPIFRGGYSRSGQQLRGAAVDAPVAIYHYRNATPTETGDRMNFELRLGIDRGGTDDASEEETITQVQMQIRNTKTGQLSQPQIVKPESNRTAYFSFPRSATDGGEFDLIVRCVTPQHTVGLRASGMGLVSDTGSFYANLLKSILIFWLLSVLVVAVAICCSTFLSWPIAVVLCIVVLLGRWGVEQLGDATKPGIGAQVATDFGFKQQETVRVVSGSVEALSRLLNLMARVLPDIGQFPATEDIERGVSIPHQKLLRSLKEVAAFGIPLLLLGYIVLKNKEVAP